MARSLHIGTVDLADATAWERYFSKLNYLELSGPFGGPVKDATLKRWRQASGGRLGLHAPWVLSHRKAPASARAGGYDTDAQSGDFRTGPAAQRALDLLARAVTLSGAHTVVFPSDPMFSPSEANRQQLTTFFAEAATAARLGGATRVWIPGGLWDPYQAAVFAARIGVVAAVDPFSNNLDRVPEWVTGLPGDAVYFRPVHTGRATALSLDRLEELAMWLAGYEQSTVAFGTPERIKDANALMTFLRDLGDSVTPEAEGEGDEDEDDDDEDGTAADDDDDDDDGSADDEDDDDATDDDD